MKDQTLTLRFRTRRGCPISLVVLDIVPEVLAGAVTQETEIKASRLEKKRKMFLFTDNRLISDMIN